MKSSHTDEEYTHFSVIKLNINIQFNPGPYNRCSRTLNFENILLWLSVLDVMKTVSIGYLLTISPFSF